MFGKLIPCGGGKPISLTKRSVLLGPRRDGEQTSHLCELKFVDGSWMLEVFDTTNQVLVNGSASPMSILESGDLLTIGRRRFLIHYDEFRAASPSEILEREQQRPQEATPHPSEKTEGRPRQGAQALGVLVPLGGGRAHTLWKPVVTVGRSRDCELTIRESTVSARHCVFRLVEGYWQVEDTNSRNGLRVAGVRCKRAWIYAGDELTLGETRPRFRLDYKPQGPAPAPITDGDAEEFQRSLSEMAGIDVPTDMKNLPEKRTQRWNVQDR